MNTQFRKVYRIVLTNTTTMESEVVAEYDDEKIANKMAMKMKDEYWHKGQWVSVEELELDEKYTA